MLFAGARPRPACGAAPQQSAPCLIERVLLPQALGALLGQGAAALEAGAMACACALLRTLHEEEDGAREGGSPAGWARRECTRVQALTTALAGLLALLQSGAGGDGEEMPSRRRRLPAGAVALWQRAAALLEGLRESRGKSGFGCTLFMSPDRL